jgi:hypothetical protein
MVKRKISSDEEEDQLANDSSEYESKPKPRSKREVRREFRVVAVIKTILTRLSHRKG